MLSIDFVPNRLKQIICIFTSLKLLNVVEFHVGSFKVHKKWPKFSTLKYFVGETLPAVREM